MTTTETQDTATETCTLGHSELQQDCNHLHHIASRKWRLLERSRQRWHQQMRIDLFGFTASVLLHVLPQVYRNAALVRQLQPASLRPPLY